MPAPCSTGQCYVPAMGKLESDDVLDALNEAIARFGPYTYYDKGPEEVMDVAEFGSGLLGLDVPAAAALLGRLWEHQHGHVLAARLLVSQAGRTDFAALLAACPDELRDDYDQGRSPQVKVESSVIPAVTMIGLLARDGRLASGS